MDNGIEYINKKRIDIVNSKEYIFGKRFFKLIDMIKHFHFLKLIKKIIISKKIKKLSANKDYYESIKMNDIDVHKKRIVVYSCVTGNYDNILEPIYISDDIDYKLFTDDKDFKSLNWIVEDINTISAIKDMSLSEKNRYIKMHPFELFKEDYDYAIYIDGNIQIVSDISVLINCINEDYGVAMHNHRSRSDIYNEYIVCKLLNKGNPKRLDSQISLYRKNGFPENYGMLECNVIAFDLNNKLAFEIIEEWYKEFINSKSGRDQISLPYVLWKKNIKIDSISTMGSDVYSNPLFYINIHKSGD